MKYGAGKVISKLFVTLVMGYALTQVNLFGGGLTLDKGVFSIHLNPYKYGNYYCDTESDLCYCQARYYSPELMRFANRDTYDVPNRYAYCNGNPISNIDPNGHSTIASSVLGANSGSDSDTSDFYTFFIPLVVFGSVGLGVFVSRICYSLGLPPRPSKELVEQVVKNFYGCNILEKLNEFHEWADKIYAEKGFEPIITVFDANKKTVFWGEEEKVTMSSDAWGFWRSQKYCFPKPPVISSPPGSPPDYYGAGGPAPSAPPPPQLDPVPSAPPPPGAPPSSVSATPGACGRRSARREGCPTEFMTPGAPPRLNSSFVSM